MSGAVQFRAVVYPGEWLLCVRCVGRGYVQARFVVSTRLGMRSVSVVCSSCAGRGRRKVV